MFIKKCDNCKKEVKDQDNMVKIGYGWNVKEFCFNCGKKLVNNKGLKFIIKQSP